MRKILLMIVMCMFLGGSISLSLFQSCKAEHHGDFGYEILEDGRLKIESYSGKKTTVKIPSKINGKAVTEIGEHAFYMNHYVKKLVIPEGVTKIEKMALFDMQRLTNITFPSTLKSLDKNCGINYYTEVSDFPKKTFTVTKGTPAFRFVTKNFSNHKIKVIEPKKVTFTFNPNGGTMNAAKKTVKKGGRYGKLETPKRKAYQFLGWYTKAKGGKKITAKTKVKKNVTKLYAHWKFTSKINYLANPRRGKETLSNTDEVVIWDKITFGSYQYEWSSSSAKKPIEWLVLSIRGNEALLLSRYGLDAKPFNKSKRKYVEIDGKFQNVQPPCTWKTSTIRSWLNGYPATENVNQEDYSSDNFITKAFNDAEQSAILNTTVTNGISSFNGFDNGVNTTDKVFLLSYDEIMSPTYGFYGGVLDMFHGTEYTHSVSGYSNSNFSRYYMWLRTMVSDELGLAVDEFGEIMGEGIPLSGLVSESGIDKVYPLVYPAIWVDLSDTSLWDYVGEKETDLEM